MGDAVAQLYAKLGLDASSFKKGMADSADALTRLGGDFTKVSGYLDSLISQYKASTPENLKYAKSIAEIQEAFDKGNISSQEAAKQLRAIKDEMAAAQPASQKLSGGVGSIVKAFSGMAAAIGGVAILRQFAKFATEATSAASDLEETISKTSVVFGRTSDAVMEFGKTSSSSMGMSENAALSAASTFGNLFRAMHMGESQSAQMSISLVQLGADLASFNNLDPTEVLEKLRAGLTGEAEPLKSLGVNINENIIKQKALTMGLWDGKGALDASTKATAVYNLILEQTKLAQGDFKRTSDGMANGQRTLAADTEDLKAQLGKLGVVIGKEIIPMLDDFVYLSVQMSDSFGPNSGWEKFNRIASGIMSLGLSEGIRALIGTTEDYADKLRAQEEALAKSTIEMRVFKENAREGYDILDNGMNPALDSAAEKYGSLGVRAEYAATQTGNYTDKTEGATDATNDAASAMKTYNKEFLFEIASAGLSSKEALNLAYSMGLVDDATVTATQKAADYKEMLDTGAISLSEYNNLVAGLAQYLDALKDKTVTVHLVYDAGSEPDFPGYNPGPGATETAHANGGSWMIPQSFGYEGYHMPGGQTASGGEVVTITPKGKEASNQIILTDEQLKKIGEASGNATAVKLMQLGVLR